MFKPQCNQVMKEGSISLSAISHDCSELYLPHFLSARCEMNQGDTLEEASPVTDVVVESNEDFYDQSYVNETEKTAAEVCSLTAPMLNGLQSSSL